MKIIIPTIFFILIFTAYSLECIQPQRQGVFSFQALSGRDHLTNVFNQVNQNVATFNISLKVDGNDYAITNFKAGFYYNDNDQVESLVDDYSVNVTGGKLTMGYNFNYTYGSISNLTKGSAFGKVLLQPFYFIKKTNIVDGYFEWSVTLVPDITIVRQLSIQTSNPKLPDDIRSMFQNILNSNAGQQNKLKQNVMVNLNELYKKDLKSYLNSEDLINSNTVVYPWKNNNISYTNLVYNFSLSNIGFKGLRYYFLFELENYTAKQQCNIIPKQFDDTLGGVQQILGMSFIKASIYYGLQKAWFNTNLGRNWDTQIFQFYAGDIANVIPQASSFIASTPLTGQCKWNNSVYNLNVSYFSPTSIYVSIPYTCTISANNQTLLQTFYFSASYQIKLILTNDYIDTNIASFTLTDAKFFSAGKYVVQNQALASYYILKTLRSMVGTRTFGAGFPTLFRKYPVLQLNKEYITMYDPSQV